MYVCALDITLYYLHICVIYNRYLHSLRGEVTFFFCVCVWNEVVCFWFGLLFFFSFFFILFILSFFLFLLLVDK